MITFRALRRDDFDRLAGWLDEPQVRRWWNDDPTPEWLEAEYGPGIDRAEGIEGFIASIDGRPLGMIQRYPIEHDPRDVAELAPLSELPPGALTIDYFIADPAARGHGHGAAMIAAFLRRCWSDRPGAPAVIVPVVAANLASRRALERAGFRRVATGALTPDNPVDGPEHVVYRIDRPSGP